MNSYHRNFVFAFSVHRRSHIQPSLPEAFKLCCHSRCIYCWCDHHTVGRTHRCLHEGTGCWCKYSKLLSLNWSTQKTTIIIFPHNFNHFQVILLILAIGQMLSRAIPQVHAAAYTAPAPVPVVYSHSHTQQPVWLEKEW